MSPSKNPFAPRVEPAIKPDPPIPAAVQPLTPEPPYIGFDKDIAASDIVEINDQQVRRNMGFERWLIWLESRIRQRGYKLVYRLVEAPKNWYVQPLVAAEVCIVDIEPSWNFALTQYHWDAWQGFDVADILIRRAEGEKWFREQENL